MNVEPCPKCGHTNVAVARNMYATRLCLNCRHQWDPPPKRKTWTEVVQEMVADQRRLIISYDATVDQQDEDLQLRELIDGMRRNIAEYDRAKAVKGE